MRAGPTSHPLQPDDDLVPIHRPSGKEQRSPVIVLELVQECNDLTGQPHTLGLDGDVDGLGRHRVHKRGALQLIEAIQLLKETSWTDETLEQLIWQRRLTEVPRTVATDAILRQACRSWFVLLCHVEAYILHTKPLRNVLVLNE